MMRALYGCQRFPNSLRLSVIMYCVCCNQYGKNFRRFMAIRREFSYFFRLIIVHLEFMRQRK